MTRMGRPIKDNAKRASVTIRMSDEAEGVCCYAQFVNDRGCLAKFGRVSVQKEVSAVSPLFNIIEGGNQYGKGTKRRARQSA